MDQTIEKVSFCAPDRNYDKAFSYICRDGTTRRWMCHCFMALKDSVREGRAPFSLRRIFSFPSQPEPIHSFTQKQAFWGHQAGAAHPRCPHLTLALR